MRHRIGIVGSGFIAKGLWLHLQKSHRFAPSVVLTRRQPEAVREFVAAADVTQSYEELLDRSDVVVECSGDVDHATRVATAAAARQTPMVTLNAEFHVTCGSAFAGALMLTEAEGDQPGCEAALVEDARAMGFREVVVGSMKRFMNLAPTPADMVKWAGRYGLNPRQVTAFTDGTKLHIEQVLVANGLGLDLHRDGLNGIATESVETGAFELAARATQNGLRVSDYVLSPQALPGVFVVAEHSQDQHLYLSYLRLGEGPFYFLRRDYHLCHLEVLKTLSRVVDERRVLLDNSPQPRYSVAAVAKRPLVAGARIDRGIGSHDVRGMAVALEAAPQHVPIGLLNACQIRRPVEPGQLLEWDDVELPECPSLTAWRKIGSVAGPA